MAKAGEELYNPRTGHRLVFRRPSVSTGGRLLEMDSIYDPGSRRPPMHFHPEQEETFRCVQGSVMVKLDGQLLVLKEGEEIVIPAGAHHAMWNPSGLPAFLVWQVRPAMNTEQFLELVWSYPNAHPFYLAVLMHEFRREIQLSSVPKRWILEGLAWLCRKLGYSPVKAFPHLPILDLPEPIGTAPAGPPREP